MLVYKYLKLLSHLISYRILEIRHRFFPKSYKSVTFSRIFNDSARLTSLGAYLFAFSVKDRLNFKNIYSEGLQSQYKDILSVADLITAGCINIFDVEVSGNKGVINWHKDYRSEKVRPLQYYKRISLPAQMHLGDIKYVWELNRLQFLFDLGKAYFISDEEKYAITARELIADWIDNNPFKLGVNWMSGLEAGLRATSLIWAYHFFRHSSSWTDAFRIRLIKQLYLHAVFIGTHLSVKKISNNHLIGECATLYFLGCFLEQWPGSNSWRSVSKNILEKEILQQVYDDGGDKEQALEYHSFVTDLLTLAYLASESSGDPFSPQFIKRYQEMFRFMTKMVSPDGTAPHIGDDDQAYVLKLGINSGRKFAYPVALAGLLFPDEFDHKIQDNLYEEVLWLLGPGNWSALQDKKLSLPAFTSVILPDSGYAVSRDGWDHDAYYLLFDCGEHGMGLAGHGHADALNWILQLGQQPVFTDSGTFAYAVDLTLRDYMLSTRAHNCLVLNNVSPANRLDFNDPFGWDTKVDSDCKPGYLGKFIDLFDAGHNGYSQTGAGVSKKIVVVKNEIIIVIDSVYTTTRQKINRYFHIAPGLKQESDKNHIHIFNPLSKFAINCYFSDSEQLTIEQGLKNPNQGWYSDQYGCIESSQVINLESHTDTDCHLPFLADLTGKSKSFNEIQIQSEKNDQCISHNIDFENKKILIIYKKDKAGIKYKGIASDASFMYLEVTKSGRIDKMLAIGLTYLKLNEKQLSGTGKEAVNLEYVREMKETELNLYDEQIFL